MRFDGKWYKNPEIYRITAGIIAAFAAVNYAYMLIYGLSNSIKEYIGLGDYFKYFAPFYYLDIICYFGYFIIFAALVLLTIYIFFFCGRKKNKFFGASILLLAVGKILGIISNCISIVFFESHAWFPIEGDIGEILSGPIAGVVISAVATVILILIAVNYFKKETKMGVSIKILALASIALHPVSCVFSRFLRYSNYRLDELLYLVAIALIVVFCPTDYKTSGNNSDTQNFTTE